MIIKFSPRLSQLFQYCGRFTRPNSQENKNRIWTSPITRHVSRTCMTVTNRPTVKKFVKFVFTSPFGRRKKSARRRCHHTLGALVDTVRATKKSSTPVASDTTAEKGAADKNKTTTNRNLAQGKETNAVRTSTSYFDPVWNVFSNHTDGSIQWIPKQIVVIGEDFHSQSW